MWPGSPVRRCKPDQIAGPPTPRPLRPPSRRPRGPWHGSLPTNRGAPSFRRGVPAATREACVEIGRPLSGAVGRIAHQRGFVRFWRAIASARVTCVECSKRDNKSSEACELVNCRENRCMSGHESQRLIVKLRAARVCLHRRHKSRLSFAPPTCGMPLGKSQNIPKLVESHSARDSTKSMTRTLIAPGYGPCIA